MRRFWIEPEKIQNGWASIEGDLFHHMVEVCRMESGEIFELLTGNQRSHSAVLREFKKRSAVAEILEEKKLPELPRPHLHLALSIPRFQKFDDIIEKCVELGVKSVHPFVSDFSFVRKIDSSLSEKSTRWNRIVKAATQQCGRGEVMEVENVATLDVITAMINRRPNARGLFCYEGKADSDLKFALGEVKKANPQEVWIIVGSEGGFSTSEVQKLRDGGYSSITMGSQVLRVETACLTLVSVIKYEFGIMRQ